MLSAWPKIDMKSLSEKIFMPILNFIVYTTCPMIISKKNIHSENLGIAHGACILFSRKTIPKITTKTKDNFIINPRIFIPDLVFLMNCI